MNRGILIAIAMLLLATGCQKHEPIKIGFVGGITGTNSSLSISGRNAVMFAVDEVNKAGGINGHPIELIIKDDKETPEEAIAADKAFIQEGVPVVIGHYISAVATASIEAIRDQNILMVSPTISSKDFSGKDDNFMLLVMNNTTQGEALAAYSADEKNNRRTYLAVNDENKVYVEGITAAYQRVFTTAGGVVSGKKTIPSGNINGMISAIDEAVALNSDSILCVMNASDQAMFAQQLRKRNQSIFLYSSTWGMTSDVIVQGGEAVEGIVFPAMFDSASQVPAYVKFKESYEKLYAESLDFSAIYSYEAAQMVFEGLREAKTFDSEAIKKAILNKKVFQGLQSTIEMDANGDAVRPQFLNVVEKGKFMTIKQVD